jgi:hypothetical protein
MIKKSITLIIVLILTSCKSFKENIFVYKNEKQKVEMIIQNGDDFLKYETPTKVDFKFTNIDLKTSSIFGLGIKILNGFDSLNGVVKTKVNVPRNRLKTDTLNVIIRFNNVNNEKLDAQFKVPIKE